MSRFSRQSKPLPFRELMKCLEHTPRRVLPRIRDAVLMLSISPRNCHLLSCPFPRLLRETSSKPDEVACLLDKCRSKAVPNRAPCTAGWC